MEGKSTQIKSSQPDQPVENQWPMTLTPVVQDSNGVNLDFLITDICTALGKTRPTTDAGWDELLQGT